MNTHQGIIISPTTLYYHGIREINTHRQGGIVNPIDFSHTGVRQLLTHRGDILNPDDWIRTGIRQISTRQGVMHNLSQGKKGTTEKEVMKPPRTEPLEYAWKKMNI
ncbi:hypothetical protein IMY50_29490 (plasmid) [Bacillus cereus]|nr:hypothetical protein CN400_26870 [Bacillus thuringiensis]PFL30250.1 hypothetical protein COJ16_26705 [Bacillus cereus]PFE93503.1 hypothetical protein CN321_11435 [Bacillus thuringiensis]PFV41157.1 hypothetical protein COL03_18730 [Bacillus thuringiensis]PGS86387.1 hypothetical protein COD00_29800 [Bacillus cereus]